MDLLDYYCKKRRNKSSAYSTNDGTTQTRRPPTLLLAGLSSPKALCPKMVQTNQIKNLRMAEI